MDLTLGAAEAATLQMALNRKFTPFRDSLSHGPIRPFSINSLECWILRRKSYWTKLCSDGSVDEERFESDYLRTINAILDSKAITLWAASDVDGFVLSAWLTFLVHARKSNCQIELVKFPRRAGSSIFGMRRDTITNPPRPVPIVGKRADFLISFWQAWTAPSPCRLLELFANATPQYSPRFLLSLLLDRYPNAETGLSRWDYILLRNAHKHGSRLRWVIANTLGESLRSFDHVGDHWMRSRFFRLARAGQNGALVKILRDDSNLSQEKITLTQLGSDVLEGRANALNSDIRTDWIGGVRIAASQPNVWVRTPHGLTQREVFKKTVASDKRLT